MKIGSASKFIFIDKTEHTMRSADEMVKQAKGEYTSEYITQTNSVTKPIIDQLSPEEQLHFVFFNPDKGFRISEPDGEEKTPDHTSLTESDGKRFLLVTDERILYIVGKPEGENDEVQEFNYKNINSVEGYKSMNFFGLLAGGYPTIEFTTNNGKTYKFVNNAHESDTAENMADFIRSQIESTGSRKGRESSQEPATDTSEVKFCPDCGSEIKAADTFCSECGNDIEQLGTTNQQAKSNSTQQTKSDQVSADQSEDESVKWTLSLVVGVLMSIISGILAVLYTLDGNIVSGGLFGMAFLFGNGYNTGSFNMSKWLATAIFLLFWMSGSFFIGI